MLRTIATQFEDAGQPCEKPLRMGIHYKVPSDQLITILIGYLYERLANGSSLGNLIRNISASFSRETMMNTCLISRETSKHNGSSHFLSFEVMYFSTLS